MKTSSAKQKGRRLVVALKEKLHGVFPDLQPDDIRVPTTSQPGADLHLSPAAREKFPFVVECKNVEKLNIHAAYEQAKTHLKYGQSISTTQVRRDIPLVVFAKNRTEPLVCLSLDDFLWLIS